MGKKEIILFSVGFLAGFLVVRATKGNTVTPSSDNQSSPNTSNKPQSTLNESSETGTTKIQEPEVTQEVDNPKILLCKEKWIEFAEKRKFNSEEQEQGVYDNFMTTCVSQS